jgi:protein-S-isoprenylcysteine O-methyltransferase Ste14
MRGYAIPNMLRSFSSCWDFCCNGPTLWTLVMFPVLFVMYARLAAKEESEMATRFGDDYQEYAKRTPRFIPRMG